MNIAIDFDGTIVEHRYPAIGRTMLFAFETMKELQKRQHNLILWTYRSGKELDEAVEFCRQNGIEFYAVNRNFPEEVFDPATTSRKIIADIYIDDRNVGGFLGWSKIWEILGEEGLVEAPPPNAPQVKPGTSFFGRLFSKPLNDGNKR